MKTAIALAALAFAAPAGGLHGTVTRGPITPVCIAGSPCTAPAKHLRISFVRAASTRTVETDGAGRFTIRLAAGSWAIRIRGVRGYQPKSVVVPRGRFRAVAISIDTGIR